MKVDLLVLVLHVADLDIMVVLHAEDGWSFLNG